MDTQIQSIESDCKIQKILNPVLEQSQLRINGVSLLLKTDQEYRHELFTEVLFKLPESPLLLDNLTDFAVNEIIINFEKITQELFCKLIHKN